MPNASFFAPPLLLLALAGSPAAQDAGPTFGHARARELAELGRLPTCHDVVVRDIVNYHHHALPTPRADKDVALDLRFDRSCAGEGDTVVLQVGYTTRPEGDRAFAAPCTVALVVDCSGSMHERGKMDQVRAGLREFVRHLRPDDEVALVAFSTDARVVAARRARGDGRWLQTAIDELQPGGNTNLHAGLMAGLRELQQEDTRGRSQRVVLLTDGIANTGVTDPAQMLADSEPFTRNTIDISTIGVGENLDVPLLEKLARGTRGLFHFVGDAQDVQKVFVEELASLLMPVARRPRLVVTLGSDLRVEHVFHEGVRHEGNDRLAIDLPDLNAGVTGVVMLRCRIAGRAPESLSARAELTFDAASTGRSAVERASADLRTTSASYTVQPGDTLEAIARQQLGDRTLGPEIERLNDVDGRRLEVGQRLRLPAASAIDIEVRKNHAIAVLAQGLRDMAQACESKRWADADRALKLAQDEARRLFPGDDQDLQRVRDIAAGHARTLQRYVDRFRDY
ncbi:MAG: VWA domain-containing protein [Planctomycetota bacterium]|nr:VWA domain-containing protein [Planctomycetota bacterium]